MLLQAAVARTPEEARAAALRALDSGKALEVFAQMVTALGGPADFVEKAENHLPRAPVVVPVPAPEDGWLASCATRDLGLAVVELGGGRRRAQDPIDHAVGIDAIRPLGSKITRGEPLAFVHAAERMQAEKIAASVAGCFAITDRPADEAPVVVERIG